MENLAREKGFVERKSKLTAKVFTEALIFGSDKHINLTLSELAEELYSNYNLTISKQGLDQRFNQESVEYLRSVLKRAIQERFSQVLEQETFQQFQAVKLKDSTKFVIPDTLAEAYPCNGLGGHKAGLKLAYEYDLKTGNISDLSLHSANVQDHEDASNTVTTIEKGELILRDLGFISVDVLRKINEQEAYFINRLHYNVSVYDKSGHKLNYTEVYEQMINKSLNRIEKLVYIGEKQRFPVRMIIEMLPQEQIEKRLRQINQTSRRKGWNASEEYKLKSCLNIFITNAPATLLSKKSIRQIYRLRWQIELIFKTWKSVFEIDKLKPMKSFRYLCHIYARLIWSVISHSIHYATNNAAQLSQQKMAKYLYRKIRSIQKLISNSQWRMLEEFFINCYEYAFRKLLLEKKKGTISSYEIIKDY